MTNRNLPVQVLFLLLCLIQSTTSFITASPQDQQHRLQYKVEQEDSNVKLDDSAYFNHPKSRINEYITRGQKKFFLKNQDRSRYSQSSSTFPCQPRHIHITLGNENNDDGTTTKEATTTTKATATGMTISFSVPFLHDNYDAANESLQGGSSDRPLLSLCHPNSIIASVLYQKKVDTSTNMEKQQQILTVDTSNININYSGSERVYDNAIGIFSEGTNTSESSQHRSTSSTVSDAIVINQYKVTSPVTNETYISDWLYHVQLNDLDYDTLYSYSIQIVGKSDGVDNDIIANSSALRQRSNVTKTQRGLKNGMRIKHKLMNRKKSRLQHQKRNNDLIIGTTPTFQFKTPPKPVSVSSQSDTEIKPTKFVIVGDLGQTYNSTVTMLNMLYETKPEQPSSSLSTSSSTPASIILIAGDMSYANSIQPQWDDWFTLIEPLISQTPLLVAAGNHEIECDLDSHLPFVSYENRFFMPNRIADASIGKVDQSYFDDQWGCATPSVFEGMYDFGNAFYSFTYGLIKTIVLSSYSDTTLGSAQYQWLHNELENNVDRDITPWVTVMMHTQFYTTFKGHDNETQTVKMRQSMESLFYEYKVNFVFSGHDHAYMRSKNMYNGTVNDQGPIYFIVGEGGNREHHSKYYVHDDPEEWVAVRDKSVYGFGTLEATNRTSARWRWIMDPNEEGAAFSDDVWLCNNFYF